jgi:hypothetical protein
MVGHFEPSEGDLGVLSSANYRPRHTAAAPGDRIPCDLYINPPDPVSYREDSATPPPPWFLLRRVG